MVRHGEKGTYYLGCDKCGERLTSFFDAEVAQRMRARYKAKDVEVTCMTCEEKKFEDKRYEDA